MLLLIENVGGILGEDIGGRTEVGCGCCRREVLDQSAEGGHESFGELGNVLLAAVGAEPAELRGDIRDGRSQCGITQLFVEARNVGYPVVAGEVGEENGLIPVEPREAPAPPRWWRTQPRTGPVPVAGPGPRCGLGGGL